MLAEYPAEQPLPPSSYCMPISMPPGGIPGLPMPAGGLAGLPMSQGGFPGLPMPLASLPGLALPPGALPSMSMQSQPIPSNFYQYSNPMQMAYRPASGNSSYTQMPYRPSIAETQTSYVMPRSAMPSYPNMNGYSGQGGREQSRYSYSYSYEKDPLTPDPPYM